MEFDTVKHAARHRWQYILPRIGIEPRYLRNTHQPCPVCGGRDRFRFDDKDGQGTYYCNQCGAGNGFTLVMKHLHCGFPEAAHTVARILGLEAEQGADAPVFRQPVPAAASPEDRQEALLKAWNAAAPLGSIAADYCRSRGLAGAPETDRIRFLASAPYRTRSRCGSTLFVGCFPALVAAVADTQGGIQGLHYTYLQQRGGTWQKLQHPHPETGATLPAKKMQSRFSGSLKGCGVAIEPPNAEGQLLVAEGIESALAARELFGIPCQALLSANGVAAWQMPEGIKELLIAADNDIPRPVGREAAIRLADRLNAQGVTVRIWQPEAQGTDALDYLNAIQQNRPVQAA